MTELVDLFDPLALLAVWAGAFLIVTLQESTNSLIHSFSACRILLRSNPVQDAQLARQTLHRVETVIDLKGIQCIDRINCESHFVSRAIERLAVDNDARRFFAWSASYLNDKEERHNSVIRFWLSVADIAPAIGMVGTLIGLVSMFRNVDDASQLGSAMSIALLTTLYGLILSNIIAAPIGQRFLRLSSEELKWQRILTDKLVSLAQSNISQRPLNAAA